MGESNHFDGLTENHEYDVVGKRMDGHLADIRIVEVRDAPADLRKLFDQT